MDLTTISLLAAWITVAIIYGCGRRRSATSAVGFAPALPHR